MRKYHLITLTLFIAISIKSLAQKSPEKVIKILVDKEWFFNILDVPGKVPFISERDNIPPDDSCQKYTSFKFLSDNKVEFRNYDTVHCKGSRKTEVKHWSLIKLHDNKNKQYNGIRITEEVMPERESYDKNTYNDEIYLIVFINNNQIQLVSKPEYTTPTLNKIATYFRQRKY